MKLFTQMSIQTRDRIDFQPINTVIVILQCKTFATLQNTYIIKLLFAYRPDEKNDMPKENNTMQGGEEMAAKRNQTSCWSVLE